MVRLLSTVVGSLCLLCRCLVNTFDKVKPLQEAGDMEVKVSSPLAAGNIRLR